MCQCSLWIKFGLPTIDWEMLIYDPTALRIEPTDLLGSPGTSYVSQELQEETNPGICLPDKDLLNTDTDMPDAADDQGFPSQFGDAGELLTVVYYPRCLAICQVMRLRGNEFALSARATCKSVVLMQFWSLVATQCG